MDENEPIKIGSDIIGNGIKTGPIGHIRLSSGKGLVPEHGVLEESPTRGHIAFNNDQVNWRVKNGVVTESITMRNHLEAFVSIDPKVNHRQEDGECFYCCELIGNSRGGNDRPHAADCPYVAAKAFLERGCVP